MIRALLLPVLATLFFTGCSRDGAVGGAADGPGGVTGSPPAAAASPSTATASPAPVSSGAAAAPWREAELKLVGSEACRGCHQPTWEAWQGSHHQLAMQEATADSVLGAFDGSAHDHHGEITRFTGGPGAAVVETIAPGGEPERWQVTHTFGVEPLQQYLLRLPGGRWQATTVAWDTRSASAGGQRWFHLYPDEPTPPGDPLHWRGELQNWNSQCAECHSTGVEKRYDFESDSYDTRYAEISVGCEACHGRGSRHVAWARAGEDGGAGHDKGLELRLAAGGNWVHRDDSGIAVREPPLLRNRQPEACGRCHARRGTLTDAYRYGRPLLETHRPAVIERGLYFADGQILDEVYVYGSFLQSKMYQAGVTCTDCHDPHAARLKYDVGAVCARCHRPDVFAVAAHSRHAPEAAGCVDCHMTERRYMVLDGRRDHSFRIPRPDLSVALGTPNACTQCHEERSDEWAARTVADWYPGGRHGEAHWGTALAAAWAGRPEAVPALTRLVEDDALPAIVRASALQAMRGLPLGSEALGTIDRAADDAEPLLRFSALTALEGVPPRIAVPIALRRLEDPIRGVRIPAAGIAAPADGRLPPPVQQSFERAAAEFLGAARYQFDREAGHVNHASLLLERGRVSQAERGLREAMVRYPRSPVLAVNLADVLRRQGRDAEGAALLEQIRQHHRQEPAVREALALAYVRAGRHADAVPELRTLVSLQPDSARAGVLLVLALERVGEQAEAGERLRSLRERFPSDPLVAAVRLETDSGTDPH